MDRLHTLSDDEIQALQRVHGEGDEADVRSRCDMIVWSNETVALAGLPVAAHAPPNPIRSFVGHLCP